MIFDEQEDHAWQLRNPIPEVSYTSEKNIGLNLVIKVQTHCI